MIREGTKQFDLYDFFSVLLPGIAFLLGVFPFLPHETEVFSPGLIIPLLVGGFVVGRAIHATSLWIEQRAGAASHRAVFRRQFRNPSVVTPELVESFHAACRETFTELDLPDSPAETAEDQLIVDTLYGLVRSTIHMDARGRSRTFQAVYDFYRSMWIISLILTGCYVFYAIGTALGLFDNRAGYLSYIGSLDITPGLIVFASFIVMAGSYLTFRRVRQNYREFYIQYLLTDFVVLQSSRNAESVMTPSQRRSDTENQ